MTFVTVLQQPLEPELQQFPVPELQQFPAPEPQQPPIATELPQTSDPDKRPQSCLLLCFPDFIGYKSSASCPAVLSIALRRRSWSAVTSPASSLTSWGVLSFLPASKGFQSSQPASRVFLSLSSKVLVSPWASSGFPLFCHWPPEGSLVLQAVHLRSSALLQSCLQAIYLTSPASLVTCLQAVRVRTPVLPLSSPLAVRLRAPASCLCFLDTCP